MKAIECDMCTSQMFLTKTMKIKKGYNVRAAWRMCRFL
jgi:hypothetical protein